jgi:tetratricopeptide (TPR) repeat protein
MLLRWGKVPHPGGNQDRAIRRPGPTPAPDAQAGLRWATAQDTSCRRGPHGWRRIPRRARSILFPFEIALKSNPNNVLAANNLGFTYVKMERLPEAITWYEKTLVLDPRRALAYANLGDAYAKVGRIDDAKRAYARFLELRPDHKIAPAVRERLSKLP